MSHLIREQRINKNGVSVTKMVLPSKQVALGKPIPAPALPTAPRAVKTKSLTVAQTTEKFQHVRVDSQDRDEKLFASLGESISRHSFPLAASDEQIYDVLSVASPGNAMAMLGTGIKSAEEAEECLRILKLDHLIQDNRSLMQEALQRRISPDKFLSAAEHLGPHRESRHFMDAVEVLSMKSLKEYDFLPHDILRGHARLADLKTIGIGRIKKSDSWGLMRRVLQDLSTDDAGYKAEDVKKILDKYGASTYTIDVAVVFADVYGAEFAHTINLPSTELRALHYKMRDETDDFDRIRSVLKYADTVATLLRDRRLFDRDPITENDMIIFHDAEIDPEIVAAGNLTAQQADAIKKHGITPSVADGWL